MVNQNTIPIIQFNQLSTRTKCQYSNSTNFNQNTKPIFKFNQCPTRPPCKYSNSTNGSTRTQGQYSNSTNGQPEHNVSIPIQPNINQNTMRIFLFNQLSNRTPCQYSNSTKLSNRTPCQYSYSTNCQTEHYVSIPIQPNY